jgi:hypothetical protein
MVPLGSFPFSQEPISAPTLDQINAVYNLTPICLRCILILSWHLQLKFYLRLTFGYFRTRQCVNFATGRFLL